MVMARDRPFLFAITEQSTGAILFMGKVVKM
jgi:serine protease inhibitor